MPEEARSRDGGSAASAEPDTAPTDAPRVSATTEGVADWVTRRNITEVECLVPDMAGVPRGKILPAHKFIAGLKDKGLRLPESVFIQTVTGDFPEEDVMPDIDRDMYLRPDPATVRIVPWYEEPTAQVIADCHHRDGSPVEMAPRQVLRRVLALYEARGWTPVIAPEIEFYLVKVNTDPDYPLEPPIGRSGRPEIGRQAFGIDAVNEFDPLFEDVYDYAEAQGLDVDTLHHEGGAAQMEVNFEHGAPLDLADQVFLFKRTVHQTALRHGVYATFMAKPLEGQPGSAMHMHQSVADSTTGRNLFATPDGGESDLFRHHIGGLQKFLPQIMLLLAPNVNSYRRLVKNYSAPINMHWGHDNRTVGLRVPVSQPHNTRIENRLSGADANPYLAVAASLVCGYLGMVDEIAPTKPITGSGYTKAHALPKHLPDAIDRFNRASRIHELLGPRFCTAFAAVKMAEWDAYQDVVSSWEREYLLLNV